MKIKQLNKWIKNQKKINKMNVSYINFDSIKGWHIGASKIYNDKKKFFSIESYKFNDQSHDTYYVPEEEESDVKPVKKQAGGRKTKKSFAQGYCYRCLLNSPETSECIMKPELCRAHEGKGRDADWEMAHHMQQHLVTVTQVHGAVA